MRGVVFLYATDEMIKKKIVTIAYVYDGYYGIKEDVFMWTDEMIGRGRTNSRTDSGRSN